MRPTFDVRVSNLVKAIVVIAAMFILPLAPMLVRAQRSEEKAANVKQEPAALVAQALKAADPNAVAASKKVDWLRGTGETLEMRIAGEILDESGKPAEGAKLTAVIVDGDGKTIEQPTLLKGNLFEAWAPVGKLQWFGLHLACNSSDGRSSASTRIGLDSIRQSAIEGIKLELKPFDHTIEIRVVGKGKAVDGAKVRLNSVMRRELQAITDKDGIARYGMFKNEFPTEITAWTADHQIGGYTFSRQPSRDPNAAQHTIELSPCKPQKIRFVDVEKHAPVEGVHFVFYVATPNPFYNFVGLIPDASMKTNAKGEATFEYFPDWPAHYFYVDRIDKEWVKAGEEIVAADGTIEVQIKRSQIANRKRVTGQVTSSDGNGGGFCVTLRSFQAEEKNKSDHIYGFTDAQGRFSVDVLPGATYCAHVLDERLFSDMIDLLPYDPKTDTVTEPKLTVAEGNPVEVFFSEGPNKKPIAGQSISLFNYHPYTWLEKGETRHGSGMHQWFIKTDEKGIARGYSRVGQDLNVNVFQPDWDMDTKVKTKAGETTKVEMNRPVAARYKFAGQLVSPPGLESKLEGAEVVISAMDGLSRDENKLRADAEGKFTFETAAASFGIFAFSADGRAAGGAILESGDVDNPLILDLTPTTDYHGRLTDDDGAPIASHPVEASIAVRRDVKPPARGRTMFTARSMTVKTDAEGNFTIPGVPYYLPLSLEAPTPGKLDQTSYVDEVRLTPDEKRPRQISRLSSRSQKPIPLSERFAAAKRDAKLGGWRMMVVLFDPTEANEEFVNLNFYNYDQIPEVSSYMHVYHRTGGPKWLPASSEFAKSMSWPEAKDSRIFAVAMDAEGKELGRVEVDAKEATASDKARKFVRDFAPQPDDAKKKWDEAFALAAKTNRKVWVRVSQRFCGPCFVLSRWLDDQKELIEKDYVLLKVCNVRDIGGADVAARFWDYKSGNGVPFHAIFDVNGQKLIDSAGPLGNIGAPSGYEGGRHLRKMLMESRKNLTDEEIDELIKSLPE